MIDVLVLAAHPLELEPLVELLRGRPSGPTVALEAVGVGLVAAGIGTAKVLARTKARAVLLIGSVGVYPASKTAKSALVVPTGTRLVVPESLVGRAELPEPMVTEQLFDPRLVAALRRALPQAHSGLVATTLAMTTDDDLAVTLSSGEEDFENLEALAVATAAEEYSVPMAALLGITNDVGSGGREQWRLNYSKIASAVAHGVSRFLDEIGADQDEMADATATISG